MSPLLIALILGAAFGVLLQKGGVTDYGRIVGLFLFRDFTVMKIMLTAIIVGGIGVHVLIAQGQAHWEIKGADLLPVVAGSLLFGIGMVVYGYCPGTGVAAAATGRIDALVGGAGMLVGGVAYAFTAPLVLGWLAKVADLGKVRLPEVTGIPAWAWFGLLVLLAAGAFTMITIVERRRLS